MRKLLATRHHHFDVERAVFMTVLHRLMVSGSDRSALQWRRDQAIDGAAELELQHLYRAMGWLGEARRSVNPSPTPPRRGAPKTSSRRRCSRIAELPHTRVHELLPWSWKAARNQDLAA